MLHALARPTLCSGLTHHTLISAGRSRVAAAHPARCGRSDGTARHPPPQRFGHTGHRRTASGDLLRTPGHARPDTHQAHADGRRRRHTNGGRLTSGGASRGRGTTMYGVPASPTQKSWRHQGRSGENEGQPPGRKEKGGRRPRRQEKWGASVHEHGESTSKARPRRVGGQAGTCVCVD